MRLPEGLRQAGAELVERDDGTVVLEVSIEVDAAKLQEALERLHRATACTCDPGGWDGTEPREPEVDIDCPVHGCTCEHQCAYTGCPWCSEFGGDCPGEVEARRMAMLGTGRCPDCAGDLKDNGPSGDRQLYACVGTCGGAFAVPIEVAP